MQQMGVFVPTLSSGWLVTTATKRFEPTYEFCRDVIQRAEHYGMEFALAPVKFRGFGGPSEFWDHSNEAITLMAGVAPVTTRIRLFASIAVLTVHPAITARMTSTLDQISGGRFGLNIVSGWQPAEYEQMGMWPGDEHFNSRYDYAEEYVRVMRELWEKGRSDFSGEHFQLKDCVLSPRPKSHIDLVCAGQSDRGMAFCAGYGDYMFCMGVGVNNPTGHQEITKRLAAEAKQRSRDVGAFIIMVVIADETDALAMEKWKHYNATADRIALGNLFGQASTDTQSEGPSSIKTISTEAAAKETLAPLPEGAVDLNFGTLVGSYESIARMLDEAGAVPGTAGIMLVFDDWIDGMENFGKRIQPLMQSRAHVRPAS
jgi:pyrimidine oxygenase